jgi:hypothetical protein
MIEEQNGYTPSLAFSEPELGVCTLGNPPMQHDKINLFDWHCRCQLHKISEASLTALWISIVQHLQHQHCPSHHVPS